MTQEHALTSRHRQPSMILSVFVSILVLLLTGCRGATPAASLPDVTRADGGLRVAMLLPGAPDDNSWSQQGYDGLRLIETQLGAEIAYTPHTANWSQQEMERELRRYVHQDYDFIIGHGGEYIAALEVVAGEFPRTRFATTSNYAGNNTNLGALTFRDGEIAYLVGVVAGLKTNSGKILFLSGVDYPEQREKAALLIRGVRSVNPSASVSVQWLGSWTDEEKALEMAQAAIDNDVDLIVTDADAPGVAVLKLAGSRGILSIGWYQDQHALAPNFVLTSAIQRTPQLVLEGAIIVQSGRWAGKQYKFGMRDGVQALAPFYNLLTAEEAQQVEAVRNDILLGNIDVAP